MVFHHIIIINAEGNVIFQFPCDRRNEAAYRVVETRKHDLRLHAAWRKPLPLQDRYLRIYRGSATQ